MQHQVYLWTLPIPKECNWKSSYSYSYKQTSKSKFSFTPPWFFPCMPNQHAFCWPKENNGLERTFLPEISYVYASMAPLGSPVRKYIFYFFLLTRCLLFPEWSLVEQWFFGSSGELTCVEIIACWRPGKSFARKNAIFFFCNLVKCL